MEEGASAFHPCGGQRATFRGLVLYLPLCELQGSKLGYQTFTAWHFICRLSPVQAFLHLVSNPTVFVLVQCVYYFACLRHHDECVDIRGQPSGFDSLLSPGRSQTLSTGCQAWQQVPLPSEPPHHRPLLGFLRFLFINVCVCMSLWVFTVCGCLWRPEKVGIPWGWGHRQLSVASCGCWALNLGGLQEQQASYLVSHLFSAHTDTTTFNFWDSFLLGNPG